MTNNSLSNFIDWLTDDGSVFPNWLVLGCVGGFTIPCIILALRFWA